MNSSVAQSSSRPLTPEIVVPLGWNLRYALLNPKLVQIIPREFATKHNLILVDTKAIANSHIAIIAVATQVHRAEQGLVALILEYLRPMGITEVQFIPQDLSAINRSIKLYYQSSSNLDYILAQIVKEPQYNLTESHSLPNQFLEPYPEELNASYRPSSLNDNVPPNVEQWYIFLVNALLMDATQHRASDIHITTCLTQIQIKYRIDGLLEPRFELPLACWRPLASRIKLIAGASITQWHTPQNGRLRSICGVEVVDFRVATHPLIVGENIVIRILPHSNQLPTLEQLGFSTRATQIIEHITHQPEGINIVSGPTGAGKTTTLYSILQQLTGQGKNIMTLEDPVEYQIPGIQQTDINDLRQLDFAAGIRSILRQDPDIILVGEIRDPETAAMAVRAAQTGHQVWATLHVTHSGGINSRMQELGANIQEYLTGVINQRLVRKLCNYCKQPDEHHHDFYRAVGCSHCGGRGYRGRIVASEVSAPQPTAQGNHLMHHPLADSCQYLLQQGVTSVEEIHRVFGNHLDLALDEISRLI